MAGYALGIPRSLGVLFDIGVTGDLSDGQLLDRYASGSREAAEHAFAALVERHGPMVLRVCRRQLDDPNDADDAFQATFLLLLRQAGSIRSRGSVAAWLHGVAMRVASRARVDSARRRRIEQRAAHLMVGGHADPDRLDLETLIDDELARLPEKYRQPIVLCYLEGLTHETAAARLGWPVGTVRGRLSRARDLLRSRLTRRGVTASAALAAVEAFCEPAQAAVPAALREATVRTLVQVASGGTIATVASARVAEWVAGASRGLTIDRAMTAAGVLLVLGTVATGLAMLASPTPPPQAAAAAQPDAEAIRREMLQLKGTWSSIQTEESVVDGIPQPPKRFKMIWSIDRDTITHSDPDGFAAMTFRYSLDLHQEPRTLELRSLNTGLTLYGIYKLEGDDLTVCLCGERPKEFKAGRGGYQILLNLRRESRTPTQLTPECPNAPGCYWAIEPAGAVRSSCHSGGIDFIVKKDPQGAMLVTLAYVTRLVDGKPAAEYRPVAFDDKRTRFVPARVQEGSSGSASIDGAVLVLGEYRLDPTLLPFDRAKRLGVEVIPAETRHAADATASARAMQEARDSAIETLPRPEVGKPFAFSLTDASGRVIRSVDLKGKVVLVDCWAGWCAPCMAKMPRLKALYERRHADGLEVIGVNFDHRRARAEELVKIVGLPWAQVYVPEDDRTRRVWEHGPGISDLPRLFLIDRLGILRWAGGSGELEEQVDSLLK